MGEAKKRKLKETKAPEMPVLNPTAAGIVLVRLRSTLLFIRIVTRRRSGLQTRCAPFDRLCATGTA